MDARNRADNWVFEADSVYWVRADPETDKVVRKWGTKRPTEVNAVLRDGRLVFIDPEGGRRVDVFDPLTGRWSRLPSVPVKMPGAAAIELHDGSLLLVPSQGAYTDAYRLVF